MAPPKAFRPKTFCVKLIIYLHLATLCNVRSLWNWTYEPVGFQCDGPVDPQQPNNTGIKVLIYGLPKTGTTQMARTLGLFWNQSWHSEEFMHHLWAPHADEFWSRPENGGGKWPYQRLATPGPPAYHGHSFYVRKHLERPADLYLLNHTTPQELARFFQKCGTKSVTFDGFEELFWPVYNVSPDAKVLIMNWRTYSEWLRSSAKFGAWTFTALLAINYVNVGIHFLPWMAIVAPLMDWLNGNAITELFRSGGKLLDGGTTGMLLFRMSTNERRMINHWCSGFGTVSRPLLQNADTADIEDLKAQYENYWKEGYEKIPAHRRMDFDMKTSTTNDLCRFLGLEGHPECNDKPLPKDAPVLLSHELTYPWTIPPTIPFFIFVHWVNYKLCWGVLGYIGSCLIQLFGMCGIKCKRRKRKVKSS